MKELQLQALILHGPFAHSLDTSRPEQQFLTSKLGHGALIALFQTVGKGEACSTVAMARLSWYFKKKRRLQSTQQKHPSGELHRQLVQNSKQQASSVVHNVDDWHFICLVELGMMCLTYNRCVCCGNTVCMCSLQLITRQTRKIQHFNAMYWQLYEALYGCQGIWANVKVVMLNLVVCL